MGILLKMHFFSLFLAAFALHIARTAANNDLTIQTRQGPVDGKLVDSSVRQFLGIPYATAQRWEAPQPPPNRTQTFSANSFGNSCYQNFYGVFVSYLKVVGDADSLDVPTSEDCLNINIWTPSSQRLQGRKAAVLMWVYGGGYIVGTVRSDLGVYFHHRPYFNPQSNTKSYNGHNIVASNEDIIVVSFNYRLDIFGQPNAPQLGSNNRNFGMLDVKAAVHWVHDNIAAFGGDPERITLFGQSAGASIVDTYTFANTADTFVKGNLTIFE